MPTDASPFADSMRDTAPGVRMPSEWAPHQCTWISWPHNLETWPAPRLRTVERHLARAVRALASGETVRINVLGAAHEVHVRKQIGDPGSNFPVRYHHVPTDDAWCRDHGATFVLRGNDAPRLAAVDWTYNAWGDKYPPYDRDAQVARRMADVLGVPRLSTELVAEGGALEVDGSGLLLTTASCLLNPNRNPGWTRAAVERTLRRLLGVDTVHWLQGAELAGDDTDGHVDNLVRFGPDQTLLVAAEADPSDANFAPLRTLRTQVDALAAAQARTVVPLPLPAPVALDGTRLPASYANFYVGNAVVLVPTFDDPADAAAQAALRDVFPGRTVVGIEATAIAGGFGTLHCLTQQVPAIPSS